MRLGAWLRRRAERAASRLPYFPDPQARCAAHGRRYCGPCHRNGARCMETGMASGCSVYQVTGMHWDTCPNRVRS